MLARALLLFGQPNKLSFSLFYGAKTVPDYKRLQKTIGAKKYTYQEEDFFFFFLISVSSLKLKP